MRDPNGGRLHTCFLDVTLRLVHKKSPTTSPVQTAKDELANVAKAAIAGDRSAIHSLLVSLAPHLLRSVRGVLGPNDPDVEDVAQEAALTVLKILPNHRGSGSICRFACGTAVLVAMNARRRKLSAKRGAALQAHEALDIEELSARPNGMASVPPGPDESLSQREAASAARTLVMSLPAAQAQVLALHCMAGFTIPEISEATGAPSETVRSRLRLARQALRKRVEKEPRWLELLEGE